MSKALCGREERVSTRTRGKDPRMAYLKEQEGEEHIDDRVRADPRPNVDRVRQLGAARSSMLPVCGVDPSDEEPEYEDEDCVRHPGPLQHDSREEPDDQRHQR